MVECQLQMPVRRRQLLEALRALYDETGQPVTASRLARDVDGDPDTVRDRLHALQSYELVKRPPDQAGYVPTITGREFLDLDVDEDTFAIIELVDDT